MKVKRESLWFIRWIDHPFNRFEFFIHSVIVQIILMLLFAANSESSLLVRPEMMLLVVFLVAYYFKTILNRIDYIGTSGSNIFLAFIPLVNYLYLIFLFFYGKRHDTAQTAAFEPINSTAEYNAPHCQDTKSGSLS